MTQRRHVGSTYRLQLNGFGFAAATSLVPFLHELGVETLYVSPIFQARAGSTHGYDVIDPTVLDPALGTPEEFELLLSALDDHGLGLLVDIVPNHMAAVTENRFFADVLRHGQESEFATYFDIAWDEQDGKVLLPVLGDPLADVVAQGEIEVVGGELAYFEHRFPLAPGTAELGSIAEIVAAQHYRLADWRVANRAINYRRFFDINELIGVRQEDSAVFGATHRLVADLVCDRRVVGLRIDHVDGLRDPAGYLASLRALCGQPDGGPVIVVEKIVADAEEIPDWPVEGTTGYEFGALVAGLFVDRRGAEVMAAAAAVATGDSRSFAERAVAAKHSAIDVLFPHQLAQVVDHFVAALDGAVAGADATAAVRELTAALDVYRTYRQPSETLSVADAERLRRAAERAGSSLAASAASSLQEIVALIGAGYRSEASAAVGSWQQLTSPVAAKGVEDTALYGAGHLLVAADVGSDPDHPATTVMDFHRAMLMRAADHPLAMSSTSTHDAKRSHDVRCRLAALTEIPGEWEGTVSRLEAALSHGDAPLPDAIDRRYLYETLVGCWPIVGEPDGDFAARIREHLTKAAREAKRHSSWLATDAGYETAWHMLADRLLLVDVDLRALITRTVTDIEHAAATNSLASVVIKTLAPGFPDTYQGDDSWFLRLTDPDNRGRLDADTHRSLLSADGDLDEWRSGAVKQRVLRRCLVLRRSLPEMFAAGRYLPLEVTGEHRSHVVAFARAHEGEAVVVVVPRLARTLAGPQRFPIREVWEDTAVVLPAGIAGELTDALTDAVVPEPNGQVRIGELLVALPVAVLASSGRSLER